MARADLDSDWLGARGPGVPPAGPTESEPIKFKFGTASCKFNLASLMFKYSGCSGLLGVDPNAFWLA